MSKLKLPPKDLKARNRQFATKAMDAARRHVNRNVVGEDLILAAARLVADLRHLGATRKDFNFDEVNDLATETFAIEHLEANPPVPRESTPHVVRTSRPLNPGAK